MAKRSDIYGIDETSLAERVASEALDPSGATEDVWGSTFAQDQRAKSNTPQYEDPTAEGKGIKGRNDGRATSKDNDFGGKG